MTNSSDIPIQTNRPAPRSILVIDSGVGGLSVCQAILEQLPALQIIYYADGAFYPYGLLPEAQLSERLHQIVSGMLALHQPALVVLACNTVSTLLLPELRARFEIPFVGVVPAIKPAAAMSVTKQIGLLATPATVNRPYTDQLIRDYAQDCQVIKVGSSELVHEAEKLLRGEALSEERIQQILEPFGGARIDTLVLGCTHFPLLRQQLSAQLAGVNLVDSGKAIANRVSHLLADISDDMRSTRYLQRNDEPCQHQFYYSSPVQEPNTGLTQSMAGMGMTPVAFHFLPLAAHSEE